MAVMVQVLNALVAGAAEPDEQTLLRTLIGELERAASTDR